MFAWFENLYLENEKMQMQKFQNFNGFLNFIILKRVFKLVSIDLKL